MVDSKPRVAETAETLVSVEEVCAGQPWLTDGCLAESMGTHGNEVLTTSVEGGTMEALSSSRNRRACTKE